MSQEEKMIVSCVNPQNANVDRFAREGKGKKGNGVNQASGLKMSWSRVEIAEVKWPSFPDGILNWIMSQGIFANVSEFREQYNPFLWVNEWKKRTFRVNNGMGCCCFLWKSYVEAKISVGIFIQKYLHSAAILYEQFILNISRYEIHIYFFVLEIKPWTILSFIQNLV